ncbi:MAG TPA: sigma-70 family RNA polymerase sigma factor [Thermoanaerobaculia bacterium]|nr:sigma-70 family RNA polymerase sigma factor [Thermoanaerobaculia bacterium]
MGNDPRLEPLIDSGGAEPELERVLVEIAAPLIRRIVARATRAPEDADDLQSAIQIRLLHKLRRVAAAGSSGIQDLDSYIATLSYNVINDHLRRRYPERTRLKNRLRYVLTHDARLALWSTPAGMAAGLKEWRGSNATEPAPDETRTTRRMRDRDHPGDALQAVFTAAGGAIELEALVTCMAALWHVVDAAPAEPANEMEAAPLQFERRELLQALWNEIAELRPMQRKALLLNLRGEEEPNVIALLILTGTAKFDDIAAALEMSGRELAEIWNELPLDDLRIAAALGVTRQQVINLRKSARERLRRRLRNNRNDRAS